MLQSLESRLHLSAVTGSLLKVLGTSGHDDIRIDTLQNGVTVKSNGVVVFSTPISGTYVFSGILVDARAGDDTVFVNSNESTFQVTIRGGSGNDTLTALSFHGKGSIVDGGSGNDVITVDTEITGSGVGAQVFGGSGNDTIVATAGSGAGASNIFGGSGNDDITVRSIANIVGANTVHGGSGNDVIRALGDPNQPLLGLPNVFYGDSGNDHLIGSLGDDWLSGGSGHDTVDGGAGNDTAVFKKHDVFSNVEVFV